MSELTLLAGGVCVVVGGCNGRLFLSRLWGGGEEDNGVGKRRRRQETAVATNGRGQMMEGVELGSKGAGREMKSTRQEGGRSGAEQEDQTEGRKGRKGKLAFLQTGTGQVIFLVS